MATSVRLTSKAFGDDQDTVVEVKDDLAEILVEAGVAVLVSHKEFGRRTGPPADKMLRGKRHVFKTV